ncbi:MAG TPA: hypothetical protein VFG68_13155 [Fimbriiglobus sp.]|nr:hypothetical protein [Fimbriiglobus sp.]
MNGKRINIGVRLLPATVAALDRAGERMGGKSRAFVVEVLTALYAGKLDAGTVIPVGMVPADSRAKPVSRKGKGK